MHRLCRGTVCSVNSKQGSIGVCTADGRVLAFYTGNPSPGSRAEWSREMVCASLIPVASAGNPPVPHSFCHWRSRPGKMPIRAPCSGTVRAVSDTALTLAAADGRTLKFEAVPGKSFPEELKKRRYGPRVLHRVDRRGGYL